MSRRHAPELLAPIGGAYSSEWLWSKIWKCLRVAPDVFHAAHSWVELADYIPAVLSGVTKSSDIVHGMCAAGHKGLYSEAWGGLPSREFLSRLDPELGSLRDRMFVRAYPSDRPAGNLSAQWAATLGLRAGIPIAMGSFDAHYGAVGAGVAPGALVKIIGTSTCDIAVAPADARMSDIPGVCGIVHGSVMPGYYGLEAGQSAVGDILRWWVEVVCEGDEAEHQRLTSEAAQLQPGESGLLALDWNNGNRTILVDQRLTGLLLGQTLYTTPGEVYRALIEATAFGALTIINRLEEYGVPVEEVINCGGIAEKNAVVMQIYADVIGRPMKISRSAQTCALGAAIAGAVAAGRYDNYADAQGAMTGLKDVVYTPNPEAHEVYQRLYVIYRKLHGAFGTSDWNGNLFDVMKTLLDIRDEARR
jgi:L-ribulokinase